MAIITRTRSDSPGGSSPHGQAPSEGYCMQEPTTESPALSRTFPAGAVDAGSGKAMRSGFGLLCCGDSGFPASGEESKGLVLRC